MRRRRSALCSRYARRRRHAVSTLALLALAVLLAGTPGAAGANPQGAPEPKTTLPDVEDEVMCPICGTLLSLAGAPQADRERAFIRRQIAEGKTKEEIKDALVAEYGEDVLAEPAKSGFDLTAWIVPAGALLLAATAIAIGLRRWRRASSLEFPRPSTEAKPLPPEDSERLDRDLSRYDL
jgi:cytochrome c-type biogenesis protein CcmH/NrfF